MGIIDSFSEYSLYDVLNNDIGFEDGRPAGSVDFAGFHIMPNSPSSDRHTVQYDGHAGEVATIESSDYDDVLELVDDLLTYVFEIQHYLESDDKHELVDYAGKIMTDDAEKAEENPELYIHIPDNAFEGAEA